MLVVAPIVEGHGEFASMKALVQRVGREILGLDGLIVLDPVRQKRGQLVQERHLLRAVDLAWEKLSVDYFDGRQKLILLVIDADADPACRLGPMLREIVRANRAHVDFSCVLAVPELESWLIAGCGTLGHFLRLEGVQVPADVDAARLGKAWIEKRFREAKYSSAVDQRFLVEEFDLDAARRSSPSFGKLCRDLGARVG